MSQELDQPAHEIEVPSAGWWKAPSALGTAPALLRVPDEHRLAAVGLHVSAIGWCIVHGSKSGWIPAAAVHCGQVVASHPEQLQAAARGLVEAGLWLKANLDGLDGYVVSGAARAVEERYARQESARRAGETSASRAAKPKPAADEPGSQRTVDRFGRVRFDPDKPVDWSKVSEDL